MLDSMGVEVAAVKANITAESKMLLDGRFIVPTCNRLHFSFLLIAFNMAEASRWMVPLARMLFPCSLCCSCGFCGVWCVEC